MTLKDPKTFRKDREPSLYNEGCVSGARCYLRQGKYEEEKKRGGEG
jgi:hypothetical protein